jgi:hypothetical protein
MRSSQTSASSRTTSQRRAGRIAHSRLDFPTRAADSLIVAPPFLRPWTFPIRKVRIHAMIVAAMLWLGAAVVACSGTTNRSVAGPMKAADFVHFYTTGSLVRLGQSSLLYDFEEQHRVQGALVPEAAELVYLSVYPPQTAILFAPFSAFSYGYAALLWVALSIVCYALISWTAWIPVSTQLSDRTFMIAAAAGFPPFWQLALHGQTTIVVLAAFCLGWLALERRHSFLAGCAFGLLAIKPQFGLPLAVITLARRDWPTIAGAAVSVAIQALMVYWILDPRVFHDFVQMARVAAERSDLLEPKFFQSHSLMTIARLAPSPMQMPLWIGMCGAVLWGTTRVWMLEGTSLRLKLSAVILASILVNPHLMIYDATLLVLPLIWVSAAVRDMRSPGEASWTWLLIYGLFATLLAPTAALIRVQVSVILMVILFIHAHRLSYESAQLRTA